MNHFLFCFIVSLLFSGSLFAQSGQDSGFSARDTLSRHSDSNAVKQTSASLDFQVDSFSKKPEKTEAWQVDIGENFFTSGLNKELLERHPYFGFTAPAVTVTTDKKEFTGKEIMFYTLIGFLLAFALLKRIFPKYLSDLFRLFFRTTLKQRQIREQLIQSLLPSFLFNSLFVLSSALYVDLLLQHYNLNKVGDFWEMFLYCGLAIAAIYLVKFLGIKLSGWVFSAEEATNSYLFIVFVVNKMIGIFLLPFLVLLAFTQGDVYQVSLTISWCGIAALFLYRMVLSYSAVRNQVKVNPFHFLLYFCAFELAPLLLIYKVLLYFFSRTA
ncbi:MAG: DUF4271 domain-containing protein [Chitinophagaceae bacterium]|nr:DUF4271 domain-containing protein [Chitinophagaceae bacterium]